MRSVARMSSDFEFPAVMPNDPNDVALAVETARALYRRGDLRDALRWLRKAAESAEEEGDDMRALTLARACRGSTRSSAEVRCAAPRGSLAIFPAAGRFAVVLAAARGVARSAREQRAAAEHGSASRPEFVTSVTAGRASRPRTVGATGFATGPRPCGATSGSTASSSGASNSGTSSSAGQSRQGADRARHSADADVHRTDHRAGALPVRRASRDARAVGPTCASRIRGGAIAVVRQRSWCASSARMNP